MQNYNLKLITFAKVLAFALSFCVLIFEVCVQPAYAQAPQPWTAISSRCVVTENGVEVATIQGLECLFTNIVRILTPVAGLAVFIMFIAGAFQMITAGGEAKQIQKARKTFTFAILGLVLFVGIWFILNLIKAITGVDVTKFEIPGQ